MRPVDRATFRDWSGVVHLVGVEADGFRPEYYVRCGFEVLEPGDGGRVSIHGMRLRSVDVPTCVRCLGTAL